VSANKSADFLIIGAGVIGLTSAQALLQAGYRVTLVERGSVGREASWAGGGILSPLCPWDYQEPVTNLALRSMDRFDGFSALLHKETGIDPEYQRSGMLLLHPYQVELAGRWCEHHRFGLKKIDLSEVLSGYSGGNQNTGLLLPDISQIRNPRLLQALRSHVEKLGGEFLEHHEVQKIEISGDRVVALQSNQGKLVSDNYIVAAGAWSTTLLGDHALKMDIRPIRGQILLFKFDAPPFEHILLKQDLYLIPRRDGHVLVGSTLEDVGFDKSTTMDAKESLLARVREIFPEWNHHPVKHWSGFRPGSPDNIPSIGRHPRISNMYVNGGHFRYGVTMSLASAEILLNCIEGKPQSIPADAYNWH